eukprot:TRINITY_DN9209_c0_g1_i2.p2 TRINITY_DN9209_c0_g1~~TRINITY_DN9209_c0_g1_i2.p2  ORF type:complete len:104 (+),score=11.75 TRINITY_DN9209_c0_g1_i2:266-577(+)
MVVTAYNLNMGHMRSADVLAASALMRPLWSPCRTHDVVLLSAATTSSAKSKGRGQQGHGECQFKHTPSGAFVCLRETASLSCKAKCGGSRVCRKCVWCEHERL